MIWTVSRISSVWVNREVWRGRNLANKKQDRTHYDHPQTHLFVRYIQLFHYYWHNINIRSYTPGFTIL